MIGRLRDWLFQRPWLLVLVFIVGAGLILAFTDASSLLGRVGGPDLSHFYRR